MSVKTKKLRDKRNHSFYNEHHPSKYRGLSKDEKAWLMKFNNEYYFKLYKDDTIHNEDYKILVNRDTNNYYSDIYNTGLVDKNVQNLDEHESSETVIKKYFDILSLEERLKYYIKEAKSKEAYIQQLNEIVENYIEDVLVKLSKLERKNQSLLLKETMFESFRLKRTISNILRVELKVSKDKPGN